MTTSGERAQHPALPMAGMRVLDLGTFIAAPFAATILGEFGAEVVKVEAPGAGDPLRKFGTPSPAGDTLCWLSEARNKRSLTIDLRKPEGQELLLKLAAEADVICENFRPGTLERWNLAPERLLATNPRLVILRISGYGQTGPLKDRPGFARIAHAYAGLAHLTGMPGGPPLTPGSTSLGDYISGLYGAIGILMALRTRDQVGGQVIDLALYESIFRVLDDLAPTFAQDGTVRDRLGLGTSNACPHGHFETADGAWLSIACSSDKVFARFAAAIGRPDLADTHGTTVARLQDRATIDTLTTTWFKARTAEEALAICDTHSVPCARVNTIADIFADPHIAERGTLAHVKADHGDDVVIPNVMPRLSKTPGAIHHLGPSLGNATDDILSNWLGLDDDTRKTLRDNKVT